MDANCRKRERHDLSLLSDMRLNSILGKSRLSRARDRCHWKLRRSYVPRTDHRSLGGDKAPVGLFAAQHTSQARFKAGIDLLKTECRLSAVETSGPPG